MCDLPLGHAEQTRLRAGIRLTDGWARALDAREIRPDDRLPEDVLDDGSDPAQWSYIALGEGVTMRCAGYMARLHALCGV